MIYRHCLRVPMTQNHKEYAYFREQEDLRKCYSLDTTILRVCRQTYNEAGALLKKQEMMLWIGLSQPKTVSNNVERRRLNTNPNKLPTSLQQILPFASFVPLQDLHIQITAMYMVGKPADVATLELGCRRNIHQIVGTLRRFPALQRMRVNFLRPLPPNASQVPQTSLVTCKPRVLKCFGRLRGFKEVMIRGEGIDRARARALERMMQGPRLPEEEADSADQETTFACGCKRPHQHAKA